MWQTDEWNTSTDSWHEDQHTSWLDLQMKYQFSKYKRLFCIFSILELDNQIQDLDVMDPWSWNIQLKSGTYCAVMVSNIQQGYTAACWFEAGHCLDVQWNLPTVTHKQMSKNLAWKWFLKSKLSTSIFKLCDFDIYAERNR